MHTKKKERGSNRKKEKKPKQKKRIKEKRRKGRSNRQGFSDRKSIKPMKTNSLPECSLLRHYPWKYQDFSMNFILALTQ